MADVIDYRIHGDDMQMVEIELDPGEGVRAEAGAMMYMDQNIQMDTSTDGGFMRGFKRVFSGESFFITTFYNAGNFKSKVAFAAPYPGKIIPIDLKLFGGRFICQKDSFLCSAAGVDVGIQFTRRLGAGLFGGEGFILQKLEGDGLTFIHAGGTIIKRDLGPGEMLKIDTGCIVGFSQTVDYDIQFIGGFKNALFGGEGLFLATVRGPGTIFLQSLPLSKLADRIRAGSLSGREQAGRLNPGNILGNFFGK